MVFCVCSYRLYGENKLKKPKDLKGFNSIGSVLYNRHCKCQVFLCNKNIYVKHRDYFSQTLKTEEIGAPLEVLANKYCDKVRKTKFIYSDSWGSVVLRNEAWLCLNDYPFGISPIKIRDEILRKQEAFHEFERYSLCCTDMERMWEKVIKMVGDNIA